MEDLYYTNLEDIKTFLKNLNYEWKGNIVTRYNTKPANIEDFKDANCLIVKELANNQTKSLTVCISDNYFHILKDNPSTKYDIIDYTVAWQAFMIERKPTSYAKKVLKISFLEKQKIENEFDEKVNLIKKQIEKLQYEKNLKSAALNTTIFNANHKLKRNLQQNNANTTTEQ